jgi:hypothetical protein
MTILQLKFYSTFPVAEINKKMTVTYGCSKKEF